MALISTADSDPLRCFGSAAQATTTFGTVAAGPLGFDPNNTYGYMDNGFNNQIAGLDLVYGRIPIYRGVGLRDRFTNGAVAIV